ncbi:hypothetical protein UY3_13000 [Chelonia mydas]|uniref:Myb/SANT-like DNA-binding domain-containing protein n=1 Tax=Chelonia mydas TaxID=8469 RepID=M7B353_CHEMY|nr:hypothetical protein UY3_13000 [Chelonia mydas]
MQSSSAEVTMMESQNRKRAPAWTEREVRDLIAVWGEESVLSELRSSFRNAKTFVKISKGMKDRGHNRDPKQCHVKGDGGNTEAGFGDEEDDDDDEVVDSSQQASGETGFPDSQELWSQYRPNPPKAASWTRQAEKAPPAEIFHEPAIEWDADRGLLDINGSTSSPHCSCQDRVIQG